MQRSITFWRAWALVVGTMVGSGVFLLPSVLGKYGWHGLWGWGITATGAVFVALTIAWLSKRAPGLGGPYAYTKQAFGQLPAFFIAWGYWLSLWIGNAAIAVAFATVLVNKGTYAALNDNSRKLPGLQDEGSGALGSAGASNPKLSGSGSADDDEQMSHLEMLQNKVKMMRANKETL